jgi:hypothetical protein
MGLILSFWAAICFCLSIIEEQRVVALNCQEMAELGPTFYYFYLIHNTKTPKNKYCKLSVVLHVIGTCTSAHVFIIFTVVITRLIILSGIRCENRGSESEILKLLNALSKPHIRESRHCETCFEFGKLIYLYPSRLPAGLHFSFFSSDWWSSLNNMPVPHQPHFIIPSFVFFCSSLSSKSGLYPEAFSLQRN